MRYVVEYVHLYGKYVYIYLSIYVSLSIIWTADIRTKKERRNILIMDKMTLIDNNKCDIGAQK